MQYRISVEQSIDDVGRSNWERLSSARTFYLSYNWLRAIEGMLTPFSFYIVARSLVDGNPVAAIPCFLLDEGAYVFYNPPKLILNEEAILESTRCLDSVEADRLMNLATRLQYRSRSLYPALVCAAPFGYVSSICYWPGLTREQRAEVACRLVQAFDQLAAEQSARTRAFLYVPGWGDSPLQDALLEAGYYKATVAFDCVLRVKWRSFDEYLKQQNSKHRSKIRREMRAFKEHGLRVEIQDGASLMQGLAILHANVHRKYGHEISLDYVNWGYAQFMRFLGPCVRVFSARKDHGMIGFALFFEEHGTYYCKQVGFDYTRLQKDYCYFNVMFYEPIREAISRQITAIYYGPGSYETKMERGCDLVDLVGYFAFSSDVSMEIADVVSLTGRSRNRMASKLRLRYGQMT